MMPAVLLPAHVRAPAPRLGAALDGPTRPARLTQRLMQAGRMRAIGAPRWRQSMRREQRRGWRLMRHHARIAWASDAILHNRALRWCIEGPERITLAAGAGARAGEVRLTLDAEGARPQSPTPPILRAPGHPRRQSPALPIPRTPGHPRRQSSAPPIPRAANPPRRRGRMDDRGRRDARVAGPDHGLDIGRLMRLRPL
jgi:hypothetical protein